MTVDELYVKSQMRVAELEELLKKEQALNLAACVVIARIVKGDLQPSDLSTIEADGMLSWSINQTQTPEVP